MRTQQETLPVSYQFLGRWWVVAGLALVIVVACWSLWRLPLLRPLLTGLGAGLAALLAPLPGLLRPETRSRWPVAIGLACLIGLGAWFSADAIERERDRLAAKAAQLNHRLQLERESVEVSMKKLSEDGQSSFLLSGSARLLALYSQHQFESVLDLADVLAAIDQGNGHALYFQGEAYRGLGNKTDMRGAFLRYLQVSDHHPEARLGDAYRCSMNPAGYCAERTEWINHLMAHDYLQQGRSSLNADNTGSLVRAFKYERDVLNMRPQGFDRVDTIESSCEMLEAAAGELAKRAQEIGGVRALLARYRARYGPC